MSEQDIKIEFPGLASSFYITSPKDPDYNCIAWAANNNDLWWWPDRQSTKYWPLGIERAETIDAFIKAYETIGYNVCDNGNLESGYDKIAIFVNDRNIPTHAARQLNNGHWTSKLGGWEDIEHYNVEGVAGRVYGSVGVFMKRAKISS
jgi:hypothetical protein